MEIENYKEVFLWALGTICVIMTGDKLIFLIGHFLLQTTHMLLYLTRFIYSHEHISLEIIFLAVCLLLKTIINAIYFTHFFKFLVPIDGYKLLFSHSLAHSLNEWI